MKIKYPQPYSIKVPRNYNDALRERMIEYEHNKAKYRAKYLRSKLVRRLK